MIEPRLYRAAFVPAVLALVIVAFSLQNKPPPLPEDPSADVLFDGAAVADGARRLARRYPDRQAGAADDHAAADAVAAQLTEAGFQVEIDSFTVDGLQLANVIGTRPGATRQQVVLMAPRDALYMPDLGGSASDTATLLELARALEGRPARKTLVLVSVDGTTLGQAGVRRFIENAEDSDLISAVLALSNLGVAPPARPALVEWPDGARQGSIGLQRTALEALRRQIPDLPGPPGLIEQMAHLVLPVGIGAQGVLIELGFDAIRFSGSGELPPPADASAQLDPDRLEAFGRAVLQTASAIDVGGAMEHGPERFLTIDRKVLPGWAVSLLAFALIAPALVASIDAVARARRRREPVGPWLAWVGRSCLAFVAGLLLALLIGALEIGPYRTSDAPLPQTLPLDAGAATVLVLVAGVVAGAWLGLRPLPALERAREADSAIPGAGVATSLVLSVTAFLVWMPFVGVGNPFAALILVLPVHLWMLATLSDAPMAGRVRAALFLAGLALPAGVALYYMIRLGMDPFQGAWYALNLVGGGQVGLYPALLGCVLVGTAVSVLAIIVYQSRPPASDPGAPSLLGPGGHAGPGSLGAVASGRRREH
jgi:hypothetical protein